MSRIQLPKWVVTNAESVRRECARYRDLTPAQRLEHLRAACRAAMWQARALPDWERLRREPAPLPASTLRALERLQREARRKRES